MLIRPAMLDEAYRARTAGTSRFAPDGRLRWMTRDPDFDPTVWWPAERDGEPLGCARLGLVEQEEDVWASSL